MKKALIIGGTGLLGRGIAREFLKADWNVSILSRGERPLPGDLRACTQLTANRKEPGALRGVLQNQTFDCVVDCAAYNREDAQTALEVFTKMTGHYWFISTDFVYAADPAARYPITTDAVKQTQPPYAGNKLEAEVLLLDAAREKQLPVTLLRPPHILGEGRPAGCDPLTGGRDEYLVKRLRSGETLPMIAGGNFLIQPVWSREVGRCILALQGETVCYGHLYNIAGAECVTTRAYYQCAAELCGAELNIRSVDAETFAAEHPDQAHIARHRIYDTRPLERLGFAPSLSLRNALEETLAPWL